MWTSVTSYIPYWYMVYEPKTFIHQNSTNWDINILSNYLGKNRMNTNREDVVIENINSRMCLEISTDLIQPRRKTYKNLLQIR